MLLARFGFKIEASKVVLNELRADLFVDFVGFHIFAFSLQGIGFVESGQIVFRRELPVSTIERCPKGKGLRRIEQVAIMLRVDVLVVDLTNNFGTGQYFLEGRQFGTRRDVLPKRTARSTRGGRDVEMVVRTSRKA